MTEIKGMYPGILNEKSFNTLFFIPLHSLCNSLSALWG